MERVFGETLEKPLREKMKHLSRFVLSEKFDPQCRELKQRYPLDLIHCWAGRIYENTALVIAESERQGKCVEIVWRLAQLCCKMILKQIVVGSHFSRLYNTSLLGMSHSLSHACHTGIIFTVFTCGCV